MRRQHYFYTMLLVMVALTIFSCKKDVIEAPITDEDQTTARATYSSRSVNWTRSDGTYTSSTAATDFGNVSGWVDSRAYISGNTCRIKLMANMLTDGGITANISVPTGSDYELQFDMKFHSAFDWSRGGKVGFGFRIGDGNTGCDPGTDGNGGSLRIMWYNDGSRTFIRPYVYYKDQPSTCGNNFGKTYPSSGSLSKGTWYTVKMRAKSNTGSSTNGTAQIIINGTTLLSQTIRWTTNDTKRLINKVAFHSFRGGSDDYWMSSTDGYIYYDNLTWNRLAN